MNGLHFPSTEDYTKLKELYIEFTDNIDSWVETEDETMILQNLLSVQQEIDKIKGWSR